MRPALPLLACLGLLAGCGGGATTVRTNAPPARTTTTAVARPPRPHHRLVPRLKLPADLTPRTVPVAILTYHRVAHYDQEKVKSQPDETVEPETFFAHLRALHDAGFHTISQQQLFEALINGKKLPRKPVMITVDDGYVDDVLRILPALRYFHDVATFYVITQRLGEGGFHSHDQVRKLDDAGMDIGAHTRHHVNLPGMAAAQLTDEVAGSRRDLERILHHRVYWFAYPFGAHDAAAEDAVRKAGFLLATTTQGGTPSSTALMTEPRVHVGRTATPASVVALAGAG